MQKCAAICLVNIIERLSATECDIFHDMCRSNTFFIYYYGKQKTFVILFRMNLAQFQ